MSTGRIGRLHEVTTEIVRAESEDELVWLTVEAAKRILNFDYSYVCLAEGDEFVVAAMSPEEEMDRLQTIPIDHGITGISYERGESFLIDDVAVHPLAEPVHDFFGAAISIPMGEFGVFQAVSEEKNVYDGEDLELAEILIAYATETLARIRSEERLQRQNDRLDQFANIVSHDLRSPLTVARGRLELAREECETDHLDDVERAHDRMAEMIDDLLSLAREGKTVTAVEPVDLAATAEDCWLNVETDGATLRVETDRVICADESRLQQLLTNLFRNAIEHGGRTVTVTVDDLPSGFSVSDDGPGIPPAERGDVLEYGYSSKTEGTGLGLSIVTRIAEAHGWDVEVTDGDDGGARFILTGVRFAE